MYFTKTVDNYKCFLYNVATTEKGGPHMKKIIILFFLICAIPLSACSKAPEQVPAPHGAAAHLAIGAFRG